MVASRFNLASRRWRRGFSMIEATMSVVMVGGLLAMSLTAFGGIGRVRRLQAERQQAFSLGEQLLTEIMQEAFQDPTGSATEANRALWDDIPDYNNYSETTLVNKAGQALSGCAGWSRSVKVDNVSPADPTTKISPSTLLRITVTVKSPTGRSWAFQGLRSQLGAYEQTPATTTNYLTYTGVDLQIGTTGATVRRAAHPLNITTSQ